MKTLEDRLVISFSYKDVAERGPVFTDPKFPAANATLGDDEDMKELIKKKVTWKRVPEVYSSYKLFKGIDVDDIIQGELGDCYFLSAITGVSENPNRILKLFLTNKENRYGCYAINLYVCGSLKIIVLDDYFPALGKTWPLTHSRDSEIWVMLLEKAWAKAHGDYGIISGGDSRESLSALTGAPTTLLRHNERSKEDLWKLVISSTKKKYIMSTGGAKAVKGLYSGHAYSLLKAVELNTRNMGVVRLVQIRNPWGEYEWNGDWSDTSGLWTPELRVEVGHTIADDGTFFMAIDDFYNLYSYTFVCQCVDSYIHSDVVIQEHEACVVFELLSETKGFFSAHQLTPRMSGNRSCKPLFVELYGYRDRGLEIVKATVKDDKNLNFSNNPAGCNALGTATIEVVLPPGLYVMHAFYLNKDVPETKYICFTSYSSKAVDLIQLRGKTSVKNISRAELMSTIETYMKQRNIVPQEVKVAAGTATNCANGHPLKLLKVQAPFRCDLCRNQRHGDRYSCAECKYDVCTNCRGTQNTSAQKNEDVKGAAKIMTACPKGHELVCKKPSNLISPLSICSACGQVTHFSSPHWICEACSYYLCSKCRTPTAPPSTQPKALTLRCTMNHTLRFEHEVYPENCFDCDKCTRQGVCTAGRWHCGVCNYDLCACCAPPPAGANNPYKGILPSEPVVSSVTTACNKDHILWFSMYKYLSGIYECNKCFSKMQCDEGRWFCIQCEYDICPNCRAPPADVDKYIKFCNNGHAMTQSTGSHGQGDSYYRCSFCRKPKFIGDNRWWCPICNYNVCPECAELDIENLDWPEPVEREDRWCKGGHEFVRTREKYASFTCQKEDREVSGQGSCMCVRCGMVQCAACAPKSGTILEEPQGDPQRMPARVGNENDIIDPTGGLLVVLVEKISTFCMGDRSESSGRNDDAVKVCGQPCNLL